MPLLRVIVRGAVPAFDAAPVHRMMQAAAGTARDANDAAIGERRTCCSAPGTVAHHAKVAEPVSGDGWLPSRRPGAGGQLTIRLMLSARR